MFINVKSIVLCFFSQEVAGTYMYLFDHRPSMSSYPDWVRADHGQEIPLVVGEPHLDRFPDLWTGQEKQLSMNIMKYWTNFAKTG